MNHPWIVDVGAMSQRKALTFMQELMLKQRDKIIEERNIIGYKKVFYKFKWWMKHGVI